MGKKIVWNDQAKAQLRAIDQTVAIRILNALARFAVTGEGDIKRLQGFDRPNSVCASVTIVSAFVTTVVQSKSLP